jgi:peptide/nickel transport system permease protein
MLAVVVAGPWVAPYPPTRTGVGLPLHGPSGSHLFGTDEFGRDIFSRGLAGGRGVVVVPLLGILLAFLLGGLTGMVAGYARGRVDAVFTRAVDLSLSLPPLLLVLLVITGAGGSSAVVVLTLAVVFAPRIARVVRGAAQTVAANEYVELARTRGESALSIAAREILPNITGTLAVEFALRFTYAIIFVATLNFLGVGAQPPSPNWGLMVAEGRDYMGIVPLEVLAPAGGIALLSIALNLLADAGAKALAHDVEMDVDLFSK